MIRLQTAMTGGRRAARFLFVMGGSLVLTAVALGQTASFQGLGQMPGTMQGGGTYVNAVSGDGSTVVGYTWISGGATRPFRWTAAGGFEDLGNLGSDSSNGRANGASFNGSVVVGHSSRADGTLGAFRWVQGIGMQEVPVYDLQATNSDGSVAVGMALRWTAPGQIDHLGFLGGNNYTSAFAVSADGQVVTGHSETSPNRYNHAFRWTPAGGIQDLGVTNGTESVGWCISGNGALIGGEARDSQGFWRAFRWTASLGMRDIGTLGGPMSTAHGASFDGSVIVGKSLITSSSSSLRAFRWTAASGMRDLKQALLNAGVSSVQNWTLAVAADVSDDGTIIVGWGYPPSPPTFPPAQPFIAVLPAPGGGGGATLASLTLNPSSVRGGSSSTGTVTLSAAAPSGGVSVGLSSADPAVVTVPPGVTVPGGATSANFSIGTQPVTADEAVTITASLGTSTRQAVLTLTPPPSSGELFLTFKAATSVPGVGTVQNEDIVSLDLTTGLWSLFFDGSDVGLGSFTIDGLALLPTGEILVSLEQAGNITGLVGGPSGEAVDDSDIIMFTPTSLGSNTAGTWTFYFDGSDVSLSQDGEDIDAIGFAPDGRLLISTLDAPSVSGLSGLQDEDLLVFDDTSLGSVTAGTFSYYFDGGDVGLANSSDEDVDALALTLDGHLLLSTVGSFSVAGLSGPNEDIFEFAPTSLGTNSTGSFSAFLDASLEGIATSADVGAVESIE